MPSLLMWLCPDSPRGPGGVQTLRICLAEKAVPGALTWGPPPHPCPPLPGLALSSLSAARSVFRPCSPADWHEDKQCGRGRGRGVFITAWDPRLPPAL